jgi:hypothetical protein
MKAVAYTHIIIFMTADVKIKTESKQAITVASSRHVKYVKRRFPRKLYIHAAETKLQASNYKLNSVLNRFFQCWVILQYLPQYLS